MKRYFLLFLVCLYSLTIKAQEQKVPNKIIPEDYGYIVKIGQQVPDFNLILTDGTKLSISDLKGKVVMLQFTASWCSVCRKEMPHIEKEIWQKHKDNPDFALYGIDLMEPADKVVDFAKNIEITYPLTLDQKGETFYKFVEENAGVTRNIILDKSGKIVYMTRLFKMEEFNEMKEVIELLLNNLKSDVQSD